MSVSAYWNDRSPWQKTPQKRNMAVVPSITAANRTPPEAPTPVSKAQLSALCSTPPQSPRPTWAPSPPAPRCPLKCLPAQRARATSSSRHQRAPPAPPLFSWTLPGRRPNATNRAGPAKGGWLRQRTSSRTAPLNPAPSRHPKFRVPFSSLLSAAIPLPPPPPRRAQRLRWRHLLPARNNSRPPACTALFTHWAAAAAGGREESGARLRMRCGRKAVCACVVLTFLGEFDGMGARSSFCFSCVCGFSGFFLLASEL